MFYRYLFLGRQHRKQLNSLHQPGNKEKKIKVGIEPALVLFLGTSARGIVPGGSID